MPKPAISGHVFCRLPTQPRHIRLWAIRIDELKNHQDADKFRVYVGVQDTSTEWKQSYKAKKSAPPKSVGFGERADLPYGFYGLCSQGTQYHPEQVGRGKKQGTRKWRGFYKGETVVVACDAGRNVRVFCASKDPAYGQGDAKLKTISGASVDREHSAHSRFAVFVRGSGTTITITQCIDVDESVLKFIGTDTLPTAAIRRSMLRAPCLEFNRARKGKGLKIVNPRTLKFAEKVDGVRFATVLCMCSNGKKITGATDEQKEPGPSCQLFRVRFKTTFVGNGGLPGTEAFVVGFAHAPDEVDVSQPLGQGITNKGNSLGFLVNGNTIALGRGAHENCSELPKHITFPRDDQEWCIEFDFRFKCVDKEKSVLVFDKEKSRVSLYLREHGQWLRAASTKLRHRAVVPAFTLVHPPCYEEDPENEGSMRLVSEGDEIQIV